MAAHQAPPSLGFSRQEHWSGLPFPSPVHASENEVAQLCPTLSDPMDCSLPGSSIHGIFQATVLEWGAIAFSKSIPRGHPNSKLQTIQQGKKPVRIKFWWFSFFFFCICSLVLAPCIEKMILFQVNYLVENQLNIHVWPYFWTLFCF